MGLARGAERTGGHTPAVAVAQRTSASAVAEMAFLAEKARDDGPAESEVRPLRLERELGGVHEVWSSFCEEMRGAALLTATGR